MKNNITFGVIGFGRFGKLWTKCLAEHGRVLVYEKKEIDNKNDYPDLEFVSLEKVINCDILFPLVPISEFKKCCQEIKPYLNNKTLVVDVCSVKIHPAQAMKEVFSDDQPIIASHPLFGPDSAKRDGLAGHKIVVCPIRVSEEQKQKFLNLLNNFNLEIIECTPEEHDLQMARSQALVHFIGRGLTDLDLKEQQISTPDYHSLLRMNSMVQNDTEQLFFDMQTYNPYTAEIREQFLQGLKKVQTKIEKYESK